MSELVKKIAEVNEVQDAHIGYAGSPREQYKRFELLKSKATVKELIDLTNHKNKVVACYASWGLIDKEYEHLDQILNKFLDNDHNVSTFSGCLKGSDPISSEFYNRYWNKLRLESNDEEKTLQNDEQLLKIDSLILFKKNVYWLILDRALHNRKYPDNYLNQIKLLAFEKKNLDALEYIYKYDLEGNEKSIQNALTKYLDRKKIWPSEYEVIFDILLSFKDEDLTQVVLNELKEIDKNNTYPSSSNYDAILKKHGIKKDANNG
ncbi:hypothetical protein [Aureibacter tunicatorum]|uniref:Uncharacterized protein n=1 Tax=Aureibacter tunicatorum TaxID=866807 RepID=A0AAE3XLN4_9BACT|nr:hypothetical protein [Aureibacter tunicatorum]MDR6238775.1 hypothetical protein [Aureibacter tunicatorum]